MFKFSKKADLQNRDHAMLLESKERSDLLDNAGGVGLWEAVMPDGDAMNPLSRWTWSPEFRRQLGYQTAAEFPNVVQSWSDRLHPDDVEPTFAAFGGHLNDKTGRTQYDVTYRLKVRDGSYRWFRATGGCKYANDGVTVRACGSLTCIDDQRTAEDRMRFDAEQDSLTFEALRAALASIATGDLTTRITEQLPPKAHVLKDAFNQAIAEVQTTFVNIASKKDSVRNSAGEISSAVRNLSGRTEQQAANLAETATALDGITATVRGTAASATHARAVVSNAKTDAEHSSVVVGRAIEAMTGIEGSSRQIGQIIGVIDEIAFQTNLLALNAGVEAARAGDAGRGFAVVASEVRALAQRSAEAAKEIKGLISTSAQHVGRGVDFVAETGKSLQRIVTQVAEINVIVSDIAVSAQDQSSSLDQVNTAINEMDQVTQQNAAMVEETTAATHGLEEEAEELANLVGRFKVGAGAPDSRARSGSVARRMGANKATLAPVRTPFALAKTVGRGGAARKPQPETADMSWEEF